MAKEEQGRWTERFALSNVAVHVSLLPTGKVLYWGRRSNPKGTLLGEMTQSLDEHFTRAFLWDPLTRASEPIEDNTLEKVNLFCSGHCFLPDGTLLVAGGHIKDGVGVNNALIYNPWTNKFTAKPLMNGGRWYPSVLALPDGRALVISGSNKEDFTVNNVPEIWSPDIPESGKWIEVTSPYEMQKNQVLNLYPRLHLSPKGRIFMAGPQLQSWFLDIKDDKDVEIKFAREEVETVGKWKDAKTARHAAFRDYGPSVMYDTGKIMYMGGGTDAGGPTNITEFIDLNDAKPEWTMSEATNMNVARKQFNATVLPDGTVLVTGGTQGPGFNNLGADEAGVRYPEHRAELWDPSAKTKRWILMAAESRDRCYHSVALLLPDGRVLSAGGGEYGGCTPDDCILDAQLFEPPYLFRGTRPTILSAPSEISYGEKFPVTVGTNDVIDRVSWVRLGSVTHCRNMNQSLMFLEGFKQTDSKIMVPAPANANLAPPGHYMLFVLNKKGVPSVAPIIRLLPAPKPEPAPSSTPKVCAPAAASAQRTDVPRQIQPTLSDHNERIITEQDRPPVVVGLTPICPYGLGPCWSGAYDALQRVSDIEIVRPVPNHADSVAFVYLKRDILPDIDVWRGEFEQIVHQSYDMRGIEMTVSGVATKKQSGANEQMTLDGTSTRPQLTLAPFQKTSQLKWDMTTKAPKPISDEEAGAYERLSATLADQPAGLKVQVTGTLQKDDNNEFSLDVRDFEVLGAAAS